MRWLGPVSNPAGSAEPGSIAYLHASPPCQALSPRNRFRSFGRLKAELAPLLEQVRFTLALEISIAGPPVHPPAYVPAAGTCKLGKPGAPAQHACSSSLPVHLPLVRG